VVDSDGWIGNVQALLHQVHSIDPALSAKHEAGLLVELRGPRFTLSAEVGIGTVELITGPRADLGTLEQDHLCGLAILIEAAQATQQRLLGLGIQPRSRASIDLMCPKPRYGVMLEAMGPPWLWFTLTASDQVHVDIGLSELADATNCTSLLTAATVSLCGNSGIYEDQISPACSSREHLMGKIHAGNHRHGMPAGPIADLEGLIDQLRVHEHLMYRLDGEPRPSSGEFSEFLLTHGNVESPEAFEAFLFHEHYVWNSSRPRSAQGTLELRSACQQPQEAHMAATALGLAMVEAHRDLSDLIQQRLGEEPWTSARAWHQAAVLQGLAATEPVPGLLSDVLDLCEAALARRGRDEARYLKPLRGRLHVRRNAAQESVKTLETQGMGHLLQARTIQEPSLQAE
jgi:gamma-glutamylcysteine synthetase